MLTVYVTSDSSNNLMFVYGVRFSDSITVCGVTCFCTVKDISAINLLSSDLVLRTQ
jgi:hypothetical protein